MASNKWIEKNPLVMCRLCTAGIQRDRLRGLSVEETHHSDKELDLLREKMTEERRDLGQRAQEFKAIRHYHDATKEAAARQDENTCKRVLRNIAAEQKAWRRSRRKPRQDRVAHQLGETIAIVAGAFRLCLMRAPDRVVILSTVDWMR